MKITDWNGAYDNGWKGLITDEAFSHPAKFSRNLIFRIIEYLLKSEMVKPGDTVIDPFGGVGLGGLPCLLNGLNWIGCELESRFVELGRKNIELWNTKFSGMPKWTGKAVLLQGDSRQLASVIQQAGGLVASPPFGAVEPSNASKEWHQQRASIGANNSLGVGHYGHTPGQLASLPEGKPVVIASPPYVSVVKGGEGPGSRSPKWVEENCNNYDIAARDNAGKLADYGQTPGQLGAMPEGRPAIVSSPPFAGNSGGRGEASRNGIDPALFDRHQGAMVGGIGSEGNLAGLKPGDVAVVSSPPFEKGSEGVMRADKFKDPAAFARAQMNKGHGCSFEAKLRAMEVDNDRATYGQTDGQLGTESGETFWSAAAVIISQCYQLLPPGAPAVWVVKSFVRDGAIVDFPGQWQALCEACGFETVEVIRAWLVKEKGTQMDLNGNGIKQRIERKSFFRRTGEQNTRAKKHWQTLSRDDQAGRLWASHSDSWADYRKRLSTEHPAPRPNRSRILRNAQAGAYARDGKPHYEIETAIDFETVLITRKVQQ